MPWKCPACSTSIRQPLTDAGHDDPRPRRIYRCVVCHLDLTMHGNELIVAPIPPEPNTAHDRPPRRKRTRKPPTDPSASS